MGEGRREAGASARPGPDPGIDQALFFPVKRRLMAAPIATMPRMSGLISLARSPDFAATASVPTGPLPAGVLR